MVNIVFHLPNILLHPPPLPSVLRIDNAVPLFDARLLHLVILCVCVCRRKNEAHIKKSFAFYAQYRNQNHGQVFCSSLTEKRHVPAALQVSSQRQSVVDIRYTVLGTRYCTG